MAWIVYTNTDRQSAIDIERKSFGYEGAAFS